MGRRLTLMWHLLWGKPVMYRVHFIAGPGVVNLHPETANLFVEDCHFDGADPLTEEEQARVNRLGRQVLLARRRRQHRGISIVSSSLGPTGDEGER